MKGYQTSQDSTSELLSALTELDEFRMSHANQQQTIDALVAALRQSCDDLNAALTWILPNADPDALDAHRHLSVRLAKHRAALAAINKETA